MGSINNKTLQSTIADVNTKLTLGPSVKKVGMLMFRCFHIDLKYYACIICFVFLPIMCSYVASYNATSLIMCRLCVASVLVRGKVETLYVPLYPQE